MQSSADPRDVDGAPYANDFRDVSNPYVGIRRWQHADDSVRFSIELAASSGPLLRSVGWFNSDEIERFAGWFSRQLRVPIVDLGTAPDRGVPLDPRGKSPNRKIPHDNIFGNLVLQSGREGTTFEIRFEDDVLAASAGPFTQRDLDVVLPWLAQRLRLLVLRPVARIGE